VPFPAPEVPVTTITGLVPLPAALTGFWAAAKRRQPGASGRADRYSL
jgi:hypothetical protein